MSNKTKQNSIIFLTTLSVYLGFVLVGAPAHGLAQTALNYDVKLKVEKKSENSFSNADSKRLKRINFANQLVRFIKSTLTRIEIIKVQENNENFNEPFYAIRKFYADCICGDEMTDEEYDEKVNGLVDWASANQDALLYEIDEAVLLPLSDFPEGKKFDEKIVRSLIGIHLDSSQFKSEFTIKKSSEQRATKLANSLIQELPILIRNSKNGIEKQIYLNTTVYSVNNQVFIVTRLPRGSLDALLASK